MIESIKYKITNGEWNPKVKKIVLNRLKKIYVDGEDKITFVIRGKEEVLTRQVKDQLGRQSKHQVYEDVYDINLTIVDALHYLSYIRNYYLAHELSNKVRNIGVYDVNNAQMLERYLLLNKFLVLDST